MVKIISLIFHIPLLKAARSIVNLRQLLVHLMITLLKTFHMQMGLTMIYQ